MKTAAAYIRVSTDDQIEYSPESQLKNIREYARRSGLILPEEFIFVDEGISGRSAEKRPAFNRMIGAAKQKPKPFDVILLWKFSRFARSREDSILYKSMLRRDLGIDVVSISEPTGDDKMSIIIEAMIEAMDEYYSINLAEEVRRGMTEKATRGEPQTAPSIGYRMENRRLIVDPDGAAIVRMIFADFTGGMGYRDIATKLNDMGVRTRFGNAYETRTVEYILTNPVYIGLLRWTPQRGRARKPGTEDTILREGSHERIIDQDTWRKAQERVEEIRRKYGRYARHTAYAPVMLQGLVRCSACGATLARTTSESMQCHNYAKGKCNKSHSIKVEKLDKLFMDALKYDMETRHFNIVAKPRKSEDDDAEVIARKLSRERTKLERVKTAYENGVDTLEEYRENKRKILETIRALEALAPPPAPVDITAEFLARNSKAIALVQDPSLSAQEKNQLLRSFVIEVIFNRQDCSVSIFYYI